LATPKACSVLRNVSLKRQISTPCWLKKCSDSSFLPRNPSSFQQARRRALHRPVLLGCPAIFGYERMTVFRTARGRADPVGREEMYVMSRQGSFSHTWRGSGRGDLRFPVVGRWKFGSGPPGWVLWLWRPLF